MFLITLIKKKLIKIYINLTTDKINIIKIPKKKFRTKKIKYYVIATKKKRGFFSLLLFVLNHLKYADKENLIPVIDMELHQTLYNESKKMKGTRNSWEYFFKKVSKFNIINIYKKENYLLCKDKNIFTKNNAFSPLLKETYEKYIRIDKKILRKYLIFFKNKFKKNNILGVHFRGTDMKYGTNHPLPATKKQMLKIIENIKKNYKFDKIFLITEDLNNFRFMKNTFKDQLLTINNFRSNKLKIFDINIRKYHRYKMGEEILINALLLSKCSVIVSTQTGVSDFAKFINPKIIFFKINNGLNSKRIVYSLLKFKIKSILPESLSGFKDY